MAACWQCSLQECVLHGCEEGEVFGACGNLRSLRIGCVSSSGFFYAPVFTEAFVVRVIDV